MPDACPTTSTTESASLREPARQPRQDRSARCRRSWWRSERCCTASSATRPRSGFSANAASWSAAGSGPNSKSKQWDSRRCRGGLPHQSGLSDLPGTDQGDSGIEFEQGLDSIAMLGAPNRRSPLCLEERIREVQFSSQTVGGIRCEGGNAPRQALLPVRPAGLRRPEKTSRGAAGPRRPRDHRVAVRHHGDIQDRMGCPHGRQRVARTLESSSLGAAGARRMAGASRRRTPKRRAVSIRLDWRRERLPAVE